MMRMKILKLSIVALATVLLNLSFKSALAQNDRGAIDNDEQRVLGIIDGGYQNAMDGPASVRVGEDFKVTIKTIGSGCERQGDEAVILGENSATVMVYDFTVATRPGVACTLIAKTFYHTVTLRFSKPGEAVISIWGRRKGKGTPSEDMPTVLRHRVMVKP
jgi:hypothetical protein